MTHPAAKRDSVRKVFNRLRHTGRIRSIMPDLKSEMTRLVLRALAALLIMVTMAAIVWAIIVLPGREITAAEHLGGGNMPAKDYLNVENALRQTIAQVFAGMGAFVSIGIAFWGAAINRRNAKLTEEGQITDRFGKAVEKLASETLSVRLGGIYALERIARDSERDHWPVMEILTAYVRERGKVSSREELEAAQCCPVPADIHAVLTVIGRRAWYREEPHEVLDFTGTDLSEISLPSGSCFRNAKFSNCVIRNANWSGVDLSKANLSGAIVKEVIMQNAFLQDANLDGATIHDVNLFGAKMMHASLNAAKIENTTLVRAELEATSFWRSKIVDCDLASAKAHYANFMRADLQNVSLCSADIRWAKFEGARFEDVRFDGANREGVVITDEVRPNNHQSAAGDGDNVLTPKSAETVQTGASALPEHTRSR